MDRKMANKFASEKILQLLKEQGIDHLYQSNKQSYPWLIKTRMGFFIIIREKISFNLPRQLFEFPNACECGRIENYSISLKGFIITTSRIF